MPTKSFAWGACANRRSHILLLFLILAAGGCGPPGTVPTEDVARRSLEAALTAWRDGGHPGTIVGTTPPVHVMDSVWAAGQQITRFEILRAVPASSEQRFEVRLSMKNPAGEKELEYVVVGQGPVWVYRNEDYVRSMNMDDNPVPPPKRPSPR